MIDLSKIEQYRENNCIETKKALGVLSKNILENYSAKCGVMHNGSKEKQRAN